MISRETAVHARPVREIRDASAGGADEYARHEAQAHFSIVAVHGLGGNAIDTWTHPKSEAFWLKDFLPKQIPDARIMTFGYEAAVAFGQSTAEVIDCAKGLLSSLVDKREEPEVQNLGDASRKEGTDLVLGESPPSNIYCPLSRGIVVKQALLQARLEPRYQAIKNTTLGIIFFGTPHRGSEKATYGKVLVNFAQLISHRPPPRLMAALQTNSDILLRLTSDFRHQLPDYQIYSFYEQRPMKGFSGLIVEKYSALLEVNHEEQIPVDADHSAMCKFETDSDDTFEKVYKRVKRIRNHQQRIASEQSVTYNIHFEVPHLLSPVFTGRDEEVELLTTSFGTGQSPQNCNQRRFVLFGLGGSGKTQICLKYVQKERERYWGIFWIDASSNDRIQQCFVQIARLLQVDETIDSVKRTLANISQVWLLVVDNADDPELRLAPYFPTGNRGNILITSRNPQCQHYHTVGYREVGRLSLDESMSLLSKMIYPATSPSQQAAEEGQKVVESLGYLALAIVQAGAYIRETSCSLSDYLELYSRRRRNLLQNRPDHLGTDYEYSIYASWEVSVDIIKSKRDTVSSLALRLLSIFGFYHHDQIPTQMFYNAWHRMQAQIRDDSPSKFPDYQQLIQASISLLASFSLITRNIDTSLSLHPLVHGWCRDRISDYEEQQLNYRRAHWLLASSVAWEYKTEDYTFRRSLVFHVLKIRLQLHQGELSDKEKMLGWPVLALILGENGGTTDAIQMLEEVLKLQRSKLSNNHPNTLSTMNSLANRYREIGRPVEALQLSEEVVDLLKTKLGDDHPDKLRSMHNLAIQYSEAEQQAEALQLLEKILKLQESKLGNNHPDTLGTMNSLANLYREIGRPVEALQLSEEVVDLMKTKLGDDHPVTLRSMHNLAIQYSEAEQQAEALQLLEQVVELQKNKLGDDHPDTLKSMHNLAIIYGEAGQEAEALELSRKVVKLQKSKLRDDHPDMLRSMHNLANQYHNSGQRAKALQLLEKVVELQKSKLGDDHPDTLRSMHSLAIKYYEAGRQSEALQLLEKVVELQKSKLGDDHPDTLRSMHNLAVMYREAGQQAEALELLQKVVKLRKSKLGNNHPITLSSKRLLVHHSFHGADDALSTSEASHRRKRSRLSSSYGFGQEGISSSGSGLVTVLSPPRPK
ncbi:hypothetical protein BGW36DRAFT_463515 [Talaromyces proteolyticus]|uniref:NB-ARC domain-containing protein n=1 Tax=Talaromyces proteolyticus TaxID=1131652 RepID=A0AAD4KL28_9EURO|nr:uncharacterized protein BGW36DRAFT_463515 [Talaromyces proteolyticus]KAH8693883.1 hypothetical protein BGW36DRAFT_463515 [Talaromyces proteolyticus]